MSTAWAETSLDLSFGGLLSAYRASASLTQEELAARAGLSADAISLLERGGRSWPRASTVSLLAQALGLSPAERDAFAAAAKRRPPGRAAALRVPPDLRLQSTPFIGWEQELAQVRGLLARHDVRLLTLTGPPGAGKTRLALEVATVVADDYRDGAYAVTLGLLPEPGLVMPGVRQALGLGEASNEPPLETVVWHCRARHLLLVLDNFEHLLAAGPELLELLARCPGLKVLVTSQAALRLRAEHEFPVPPLRLPSADDERSGDPDALREVASVRLFLERATAAAPSFRLTAENAGVVAAICRRLDGLPLALELAAPWTKVLGPEELLDRLDHQLDLLVEGPRDLPERQRTMRAALSWSCALLQPEPQALLRRLSVFAGGAPLDGVEQVCQSAGALPGGVLRSLALLAEHSLVSRHQAAPGEPRVTMLESVREYGRELLATAGELETTARAHLGYYADLAARARRETGGDTRASWLQRLRREHANVRAALEWSARDGPVETGLRLAGTLGSFWDYSGHRPEGLSWLERLLADAGQADPVVRAQALQTAGALAWWLGSHELSIARQLESLAIFRDLGEVRGAVGALRGIGQAIARQGSYGEAIPLLEEAVSLVRGLDDPALLASALMNLGVAVVHQGDPRRATSLWEEALVLQVALHNELGMAMCLINLGERSRLDGNLEQARAQLEGGIEIARRLDSPYHLAAALANLGELARTGGDPAAAGARYRESLLLFARVGERSGVAVCLRWLAWVAWTEGRAVPAARFYGAADALGPGAAREDSEQVVHERTRSELRDQLGDDLFATTYEAGARLSLEEVVAEASATT